MAIFARPFIGGMERSRVAARERPASLPPMRDPLTTMERSIPALVPRPTADASATPIRSTALPARPKEASVEDWFDLPMKCAVLERPATLRFHRSTANPKRFMVRQILSAEAAVAAGARAANENAYRDQAILFEDVQCPHCSTAGGTLYCFTCRSLICRGNLVERDDGLAVSCSPGCGASGFLTTNRTEYETVFEPRICVGHLEAVTRSYSAPGTGNFFNCCNVCDAAPSGTVTGRRR
jgi:hypothetical protein